MTLKFFPTDIKGKLIAMLVGCFLALGIIVATIYFNTCSSPSECLATQDYLNSYRQQWIQIILFLIILIVYVSILQYLKPHDANKLTLYLALVVVVVGIGQNVKVFNQLNISEPYKIQRNDEKLLVEIIAKSPDKYVGTEALRWFRYNTPGGVLFMSPSTREKTALSAHRMAGIAAVSIEYVGAHSNMCLDRVTVPINTDTWIQIKSPNGGEIRLDPGISHPGAKLCAWSVTDRLTLVAEIAKARYKEELR